MASGSLLDSYIYVVYENIKIDGKKIGKYFFGRLFFCSRKFRILLKIRDFSKIQKNPKFLRAKKMSAEKYFPKTFS